MNLRSDDHINVLLLVSTFVIAVCGLVYELLAGTISSYLLGNSVYQFSIVIGLFMASMGLGSYLSRFVTENITDVFIGVQMAIALVGGFSAIVLFFAFSHLDNYSVFLVVITGSIGALVGLEIPLVIRILRDVRSLKINVSNVLSVDYLGALAASLLFPLVLVPQLGLIRTALFFGVLNLLVAFIAVYVFSDLVRRRAALIASGMVLGCSLISGFFYAERFTAFFESRLYSGEVIYAATTPYQRIVVTRDGNVVSLFLNGAMQFNTLDEYRYHEALVHPAMNVGRRHESVLILGGGDGMALREVLKYPDVTRVTLVDLDPAITELFSRNPVMQKLNGNAYADNRVTVVNRDAWKFLEDNTGRYDVVIIDLPDPHDLSLSKLYTRAFYTTLAKRLTESGVIVTQATSPFYARHAFWCIDTTLAATRSALDLNSTLFTVPYHTYVPSFGEWGFVMASQRRLDWERIQVPVATRYLDAQRLGEMTSFPSDMGRVDTEVNTLVTHRLTAYYERGWSRWYR